MRPYFEFSVLSVKMVLMILALTGLIALHINPAPAPVAYEQPKDTTNANTSPLELNLLPWAMILLENEAS